MARSICPHCAPGRRETAYWMLTASLVALIPKCPVCLAAYIAAGTGIGLSISVAGYLRTGLITAGIVSLACLTWRLVRRLSENRVA